MKVRTAENKIGEMQRRLDVYTVSHQMRKSLVRNKVLAAACKLQQPFTAYQLVEAANKLKISQATVYNVIQLLNQAQILHKVNRDTTREHAQYEIVAGRSYRIQICCSRCGRVATVKSSVLNNAVKAFKFNNFEMQRFSLFVYGECKVCREKFKQNY